MKKLILTVTAITGLLLFPAAASADSPLTSTQFSSAYEDIDVVLKAGEEGIINEEIAGYLADENNPIDVKAAVINALSWDINGKTNTDIYCRTIYGKTVEELDAESLKGDQQFCIGYLMAMDDYFNTGKALDILKLAEGSIPDSFTVSIIRALVEAMDMTYDTWSIRIKPVLSDSSLRMDMRPEAVNIILDYMALYSEDTQLIVSQTDIVLEKGSSKNIYLYGTPVWNEEPYEIVKESDIAGVMIGRDDYGIYFLNISGITSGVSSITVTDTENRSAVIRIEVLPSTADTTAEIPDTGVKSAAVLYGGGIITSVLGFCLINLRRPHSSIE